MDLFIFLGIPATVAFTVVLIFLYQVANARTRRYLRGGR